MIWIFLFLAAFIGLALWQAFYSEEAKKAEKKQNGWMAKTDRDIQAKSNRNIKWIIIIITYSCLGGCYLYCNKPKEIKAPTITNAWYISQYYVKNQLVAPSTASFPWEYANSGSIEGDVFIVNSCVDAENRFGAKIRIRYLTKLKYTGGDGMELSSWQHLSTELFE